jgi:hypothetical protein
MDRWIAGLLALVCLAASERANAAQPERLNKLYIIMAFDTNDDGLKASLEKDEENLRKFWEQLPKKSYELTVLKGADVTKLGLTRALLAVRRKVTADDGFIFYFGGHGALIEKPDEKPYHVLRLTRKPMTDITRSSLRFMLSSSKAGLKVILTDCCSTREKYDKKEQAPPVAAKGAIPPTIDRLFFRSRGMVDITAATEEEAWSDDQNGGLFTRTLIRLLNKKPENLGAKKPEDVTWEMFFPQLQRETQTFFKSWSAKMKARYPDCPIRADTQKPHAFFLMKPQAYTAIELENAKAEPLKYKFRWEGEKDWIELVLKPKQSRVHFHRLPNKDGTLPKLEIFREGAPKEDRLKAQLWTKDTTLKLLRDMTKDPPTGLEFRYRIRK